MSEKNKDRASKKWLISRMKTSGSKKRWVYSPNYAETRNAKRKNNIEDLPGHESIGKNQGFYNKKINTDLLKRFLRTQVGKDWDIIYSEIIQRIPTKLMDYKHCIQWYVADKVEMKDGKIWNLRDHHFIETNTEDHYYFKKHYKYMEFYVDPQTNKLVRIGDFKSRKKTRELNKDELRKFREEEQKEKLIYNQTKKKTEEEVSRLNEILRERKNSTNDKD